MRDEEGRSALPTPAIEDLQCKQSLRDHAAMHVKDLTTDELKALIRETVQEALEDLLPDPDLGLTLKPEFEQTLQAIRERRATSATGFSAADVAQQLGLESP